MAQPPPPSPERITQLASGFMPARVVLSAVDLDLFTVLAQHGPLTADELQARLGLHPRATRDFLDSLVALELLEREEGRYRNGPEAAEYLDRGQRGFIGGMLAMSSSRLYAHWGGLTDSLRTGRPQAVQEPGAGFFEALYADPARLKEFLGAMSALTDRTGAAIAEKLPWKDVRTFVDVGTAEGALPLALCARHPHLTGVGFDLAPVRPFFEARVQAAGYADRLRFVPGSFFTDELPTADVLVMGHILHDWNLEEKRRLLAKAYRALPSGGALVVYESIIDDDRRENLGGLLASLNMLVETPGGFDYTGAEGRQWMREVGFHDPTVIPLRGSKSMLVGRK